jgi:hypothetical protein
MSYILDEKGELGLKNIFYYFIQKDNQFPNFGQGHTYIRMLLILIPSSFALGLKPPDFGLSMGYAVDPTVSGFSTHPTLFGDCFGNLGDFGVLLGIFWALFVFFCDALVKKATSAFQLCLFTLFSSTFIIMGRGSVYNAFVIMVWGTLIVMFMHKLSIVIRKMNVKVPSK